MVQNYPHDEIELIFEDGGGRQIETTRNSRFCRGNNNETITAFGIQYSSGICIAFYYEKS